MPMVDMKLSDQDCPEDSSIICGKQEYPYGLKIVLDAKSLAKLRLPAMPQRGQLMSLQARVIVADVYASQDNKPVPPSIMLQITNMQLGPDSATGLDYTKFNAVEGPC